VSRDRLGTAGAVLLAAAAARATGWIDAEPLPRTPAGFLALASVGTALLLLAAALHPSEGRGAGLRVLKVLLAALPFLVFGAWESSGGAVGTALPGPGAALALGAALLLLAAPPRARKVGAALVLSLFLGDAVLASAGVPLLPAAYDPFRKPVVHVGAVPAPPAAAALRGERPGAAVRVKDDEALLAEGPGPWWRVADEGPLPRAGPVVRVLEEPENDVVERLPLGAADDIAAETMAVVHRGPPIRDPLDLSAYDALVLGQLGGVVAWLTQDDDTAAFRDTAVGQWVRAGGLLIGPPPRAEWPGRIARALGPAARGEESGAVGALSLGLGHVVRADTRSQALDVLSERALRRPVHTAFDGLAAPPAPPEAFAPWRDVPAERRGQGALLAAFVLAFALLEPVVRSVGVALTALALPTLATAAGLAWASPARPDVAAHAVVFDLGGAGGKRVEALWLSAGTRGYVGRVAFSGGGAVRWGGPPLLQDGRVLLPPGGSGWAIRRRTAHGPDPADREDRRSAFLRPWVRGPVADAHLRYGALPLAAVRVEGLPPLPAWTLTYR
jgi:hypothetical protein